MDNYNYSVRKNWELGQTRNVWWDRVCVWVIENFGLPGDKYTTELSKDYMIFKFKDKEDAMIMALRWGNDEPKKQLKEIAWQKK